jgi:hypothetical protein
MIHDLRFISCSPLTTGHTQLSLIGTGEFGRSESCATDTQSRTHHVWFITRDCQKNKVFRRQWECWVTIPACYRIKSVGNEAPHADPGAVNSAWHKCRHVIMWPAHGAGSASPADDNSHACNHSQIIRQHRRWLLTKYPSGLPRVSQLPDPHLGWGQTPQFQQWSWADDSRPEVFFLLFSHCWMHPTIYARDWGVQALWILCDRHSEPDSTCVVSYFVLPLEIVKRIKSLGCSDGSDG